MKIELGQQISQPVLSIRSRILEKDSPEDLPDEELLTRIVLLIK